MVVEGWQDMVALLDARRARVRAAEFERAAGPGPEVEVGVRVRGFEFGDVKGGGEEAVRCEVGGHGGADGALFGVGGEGRQGFGGRCGRGEDGNVGVNVCEGGRRFNLAWSLVSVPWA